MYKLNNKPYFRLLNIISKATYGILFFAATACGTPEPALTDTQKLALNHYAYTNNLTGQNPLEGYELIDSIADATTYKGYKLFLEANKEGLKEIKAYDFVNNSFQPGVLLIEEIALLIKLESEKPANTGIRDSDLVTLKKIITIGERTYDLKKYSEYKSDLKPTDTNIYKNLEK